MSDTRSFQLSLSSDNLNDGTYNYKSKRNDRDVQPEKSQPIFTSDITTIDEKTPTYGEYGDGPQHNFNAKIIEKSDSDRKEGDGKEGDVEPTIIQLNIKLNETKNYMNSEYFYPVIFGVGIIMVGAFAFLYYQNKKK
eukprot:38245_1